MLKFTLKKEEKTIQREKQELLESLELYYKVFFLNEDAAQLLKEE